MSQLKTKTHPAHAEFENAPDEKKFVRVYNKGEGALKHEIRIKDSAPTPFEIKGNAFAKVPKEIADLWLRDFPDRIVTDDEAQRLVSGAAAEADKAKKESEDLRQQLAALKAKSDPKGELARLNQELAELRKQNAELMEKATAPAETTAPGDQV